MSERMLILSDGRAGHENQSVALAKHLGMAYDICRVKSRFGWSKAAALLLDRAGVKLAGLFHIENPPQSVYSYVVGAGSTTYYPVKVLAKKLDAKSVTMMLPKGFRYDFDLILAQGHDDPPKQPNIKTLPVNLSYVQPQGIFQKAQKPVVGIVIGGENNTYTMSKGRIEAYLDEIAVRYKKSHTIAVTTSPRTPKEIEALVASYGFDYTLIYSECQENPIPDFLAVAEVVFVTADSTSMISEAVSFGKSAIIVLPLEAQKESKHQNFIEMLERGEYLHIYDGSVKYRTRKVDLSHILKKVFS